MVVLANVTFFLLQDGDKKTVKILIVENSLRCQRSISMLLKCGWLNQFEKFQQFSESASYMVFVFKCQLKKNYTPFHCESFHKKTRFTPPGHTHHEICLFLYCLRQLILLTRPICVNCCIQPLFVRRVYNLCDQCRYTAALNY